MRDLSELNVNFGGRPVERAAPTNEMIAAYEYEFGLSLPEQYIKLLMYSNGGHPELDMINPDGGSVLAGEGVNRFFHLDENRHSNGGIWNKTELWRRVLGDKAVPIADDGLGNVYFLDLTVDPAKVMFCDHDRNFAIFEVSPSFAEFIDSLQFDPDML